MSTAMLIIVIGGLAVASEIAGTTGRVFIGITCGTVGAILGYYRGRYEIRE